MYSFNYTIGQSNLLLGKYFTEIIYISVFNTSMMAQRIKFIWENKGSVQCDCQSKGTFNTTFFKSILVRLDQGLKVWVGKLKVRKGALECDDTRWKLCSGILKGAKCLYFGRVKLIKINQTGHRSVEFHSVNVVFSLVVFHWPYYLCS